MKLKIYVAGPLGFTTYGLRFQAEILTALRRRQFIPLDPWSVPEGAGIKVALELPPGVNRSRALARANSLVATANEALIVQSDGMLAVLDGADVDSGTAAEIGFAAAIGRRVTGLRIDLRRSGDNDGATVNLQVEHFIARSGGAIYLALEDALDALESLRDQQK